MKKVTPDKAFLPNNLRVVDSVGLRADPGAVSLWLIDSHSVVIAELVLSPEDGWELAKDIVSICDRAAGVR